MSKIYDDIEVTSSQADRSGLVTNNMNSATPNKNAGATFKNVLINENGEFVVNDETVVATQVQSDWAQTDNLQLDYINNKPVIQYADFASLPVAGDMNVIYVTQDDNELYRWDGAAYVGVSTDTGIVYSLADGTLILVTVGNRGLASTGAGADKTYETSQEIDPLTGDTTNQAFTGNVEYNNATIGSTNSTYNNSGDTVNNTSVTETNTNGFINNINETITNDANTEINNNGTAINNTSTTETNVGVTENYDATSVTNNNGNTTNNTNTTENSTGVTENIDNSTINSTSNTYTNDGDTVNNVGVTENNDATTTVNNSGSTTNNTSTTENNVGITENFDNTSVTNNDGNTINNNNTTTNNASSYTALGCSGAVALPVDEAIQATATKVDVTVVYDNTANTAGDTWTKVVTITEFSGLVAVNDIANGNTGELTLEWNDLLSNIEVRQTSGAGTSTADVCQFAGGVIVNDNGSITNNTDTVVNNDGSTTNNTNVTETYDANSSITNFGDNYFDSIEVNNITISGTQSGGGGSGELSFIEYRPGENMTQGDYVFKENSPLFSEATTLQPIGNIADNTNIGVSFFGSGIAGDKINIALSKTGLPADDAEIRIETDNAGLPSGVLADANAVGSVSNLTVTAGLTDIEATLIGDVMLNAGEKYHIVLFQGTYGSETINGGNYYNIGYADINTTTRDIAAYDGVSRGILSGPYVTTFPGTSFDTSYFDVSLVNTSYINNARTTYIVGGSKNGTLMSNEVYDLTDIYVVSDWYWKGLDHYGSNVSQSTYLYKDANNYAGISRTRSGIGSPVYNVTLTLVESGVVTSSIVLSTLQLETQDSYKLVLNSGTIEARSRSGAAWVLEGSIPMINPLSLDTYNIRMNLAGSAYGGHINYSKVDKFAVSATDFVTEMPLAITDEKFIYVSSNIIEDSLLSKTNADYIYKTDWLGYVEADTNMGTKPNIITDGVDLNNNALIHGETQYLGITPGGITNAILPVSTPVGTAMGSSQLRLHDVKIIDPIVLSNNVTYQAGSDGMVTAMANPNDSDIYGYADYVDGTTNVVYNFTATSTRRASITFPVIKGQFYRVYANGSSLNLGRFYPLSR